MTKIKLQELLKAVNTYLKVHEFKDYGPNGLQVQGKEEIEKIVFSTSASLEVIEKAIECHADALIVHHGIFWDKDSRVLEGPILKKVKALIENNISLIAYHLPLDAHREVGNNFMTLKLLGATHLEVFESIGSKGVVDVQSKQLISKISQLFDVNPMVPPYKDKTITKIASVSGGGHSYIKACVEEGIEALISGTFDEWVWDYAQENEILFIPIGHYKSENIGIKALETYVKQTWNIKTAYLEVSNPY